MRLVNGTVLGIGALLLASVAGPAAAAKYKINWYIGHPNLDYFDEAAAQFKKSVEEKSGGEIEVSLVTADADAWGAPEIADKVSRGEVEMGHSYTDVMGSVEPRLMVFEAPYLFRGHRHMEGVIEGPIGEELLEGLRKKNMIGLCFNYSGGAGGVSTIDREIRGPEDLKGLKVGVYGDAVDRAWLRHLGAEPVTIRHKLNSISELAAAGALDAVAITPRNFVEAELDPKFRYFNLPGLNYLVSVTYINEKFFNSLPEAYQKLIREESLISARIERAKTVLLNEESKALLLRQGSTRWVYLTEKNRRAFDKALKPVYRKTLREVLGQDLLKRIKKAKDGDEFPVMPPGSLTRL